MPFGLTYCAATTEKDSKDISKLEPISAEQTAGFSGKTLVQGVVEPVDEVQPPIGEATDILAFVYLQEVYETREETHTETRTEIENGQEVEYTEEVTEEVTDWWEIERDEQWVKAMQLGPLQLDPRACRVDLPWEQAFQDEYKDASGKPYRESVEVIKGNRNVLLAVELSNGSVAAEPDFCIVTNKSKEELVSQLHAQEETQRWILLVVSVVLMAISFNLMLGPAMILINIIPIKAISGGVRAFIVFISLVLSTAIIAVTYLFVRFWWVILLLLIGLAIWVIISANQNRRAAPQLDPEPPETP